MSRLMPRFAAIATVLAASAMTVSPVMARGWGGWGGHHHHRRGGVDTGDVLAGLLIFGTGAAVASAASKSDCQRRQARERDYRDREYDRRDERPAYAGDRDSQWQGQGQGPRGIGAAVDVCANEVERGDRRIESVDAVNRDGEGWMVRGRVGSGSQFDCSVSDSGRVRSVTVDGRAA